MISWVGSALATIAHLPLGVEAYNSRSRISFLRAGSTVIGSSILVLGKWVTLSGTPCAVGPAASSITATLHAPVIIRIPLPCEPVRTNGAPILTVLEGSVARAQGLNFSRASGNTVKLPRIGKAGRSGRR